MRPVDLSSADTARQIAGLRPFRPSGYRVAVERRGGRTIVHNYGHGGCGVTLSWGTSEQAVELALEAAPRRAAVIGAGAVGLATARLLQERGVEVCVYARDLPPHTTSNVAGALWSPVTLVDESRVDAAFARALARAARLAHARFAAMAGARYGIGWVPFYLTGDSDVPPMSWEWAAVPEYFAPSVLTPGTHPFPSRYAFLYRLMLIEPAIYLPAVLEDVRSAGGRVVSGDLRTEDVDRLEESVVVNCSGLGAAALCGDRELVPIKGQLTILPPQPSVHYAVKSTIEDLYMFPRQDGVVLGGSHQRGDWTLEPDRGEAERILAGHRAFFRW